MARDKDGKFFAVRDLPSETRRAIRIYAAEHDLTMGHALGEIVDHALKWIEGNNYPQYAEASEADQTLIDKIRMSPVLILKLVDMYQSVMDGYYDLASERAGVFAVLAGYPRLGSLERLERLKQPDQQPKLPGPSEE